MIQFRLTKCKYNIQREWRSCVCVCTQCWQSVLVCDPLVSLV